MRIILIEWKKAMRREKMRKLPIILVTGLFILSLTVRGDWVTKRLTWNSGDSDDSVIAVDSNNHLHVVWADDTPGNKEIYYKKSTDEGSSWTTKRLTWNSGWSYYPAIAVDSNNHLHVVWMDRTPGNREIYYKKSTDGGSSWITNKRLTWNSGDSEVPAIAVDSNNHLHVVWWDSTPGNLEIYYKKSTDGGSSWITKRLTWNSGWSFYPAIAVDSNNHLHVVWQDSTPGNLEIYYKKSTDGGSSWTTKRLTWNSGGSWGPAIAVDSNNHLHVVWEDDTPGNYEIYYSKSTDGGSSWTTKRLTWTSGGSWGPAIAVDSNNHLHVVWYDETPGNREIYYKKSTDGGSSWTTKRLTWTSGDSLSPAIAVDSNNHLHVVWADDTPGNYEIYYSKSTD